MVVEAKKNGHEPVRWNSIADVQGLAITDVICDCDGVLWRGSAPIPGAAEAIFNLRAMGLRLYFLTNHSSKPSSVLVQRLAGMGIQAAEEQAFGSATLAALAVLALPGFNPQNDLVYAIGCSGLLGELAKHGIRHLNHQDLRAVKAVVVGYDSEFDYAKLTMAADCLRGGVCAFIACSIGGTYPDNGRVLPGTGALVAAIAMASGRTPQVVGKPSANAFCVMQHRHPHLKSETTLMIGDSLSSDVAFGKACGLRTLLVETGIPEVADIQPDFVASSIGIFRNQ